MNSILDSIKKILGITADYDDFDNDIILFINSVFSTLQQIGVGPVEGFVITDDTETWEDYHDDQILLGFIKTYVGLKVRKLFDPPQNSAVMNAIDAQINELEWRINSYVDYKKEEIQNE